MNLRKNMSCCLASCALLACSSDSAKDNLNGPAPESGDSAVATPGDAAGPTLSDDYFPMATGTKFTYRASKIDGTPGTDCTDHGMHTAEFTDVRERNGDTIHVQTLSPGCYFSTLEFRQVGNIIDVSSGAWYHFLDLPPEPGKSWAAGGASGASYTWDKAFETYEVEAGTFSDCWRRSQNGYDVWEIYCKGIGTVESHYAAWGGDARQELVKVELP